MPRHLYAIVIAFLCGYAVATLLKSPESSSERELPDRHAFEEPAIPAEDAIRVGQVVVSAPRSLLTRKCTVTGIVFSHQGSHMIRCESTDAIDASLLVEIDRAETDLVAKLAPGDVIIATGRVVEKSYGTLRLDEGRFSEQH